MMPTQDLKTETIVLAGGCFWCTEAVFQQVRGVLSVESGYSNGQAEQPSYAQVCTGATGCAEVVRLVFDPARIELRSLLEIFFLVHDPSQLNRQGHDVGTQYRSGIYYTDPSQLEVIDTFIADMVAEQVYDGPIVTEVLPLAHYWPAEPEHQNFFARNPEQAYCQAVAAPKVERLRRTFARWVRQPGEAP